MQHGFRNVYGTAGNASIQNAADLHPAPDDRHFQVRCQQELTADLVPDLHGSSYISRAFVVFLSQLIFRPILNFNDDPLRIVDLSHDPRHR